MILIATSCYTFISLVTTSFWIIDLLKRNMNAWRSGSMAMQHLAHTVALIIVPYNIQVKVNYKYTYTDDLHFTPLYLKDDETEKNY